MNFSSVPEFDKDLKNLSKKWRSLPDDVEFVKPRLEALYVGTDENLEEYRTNFFNGKRATIIHTSGNGEVVKMRLDVSSLGSSDKVRLVLVANVEEDKIVFIELYAKNDKPREDERRIKRYV